MLKLYLFECDQNIKFYLTNNWNCNILYHFSRYVQNILNHL